MFLPELKLGIEFQGAQHSEPFEHFGGEDHLRRTQKRDRRKVALCKESGVRLVEIKEGEELTDYNIRRLLRPIEPAAGYAPCIRVERAPHDFHIALQGESSRWTYHHDKNTLSVSGKLGGAEFFVDGSNPQVVLEIAGKIARSLSVRLSNRSTTASLKFLIDDAGPQMVECHRGPRPLVDFFKLWSMFAPGVLVLESSKVTDGLHP